MPKNQKNIVAIGGGSLFQGVTKPIDEYIVKLTQKQNPKALFIPTASSEMPEYIEAFTKVYSDLGCEVEILYLLKEKPTKDFLEDKILNSDLIYVGGGNTLKMMKRWRFLGVDKILKKAWENGVVMSGLSAGANCWFRESSSDSMKYYGQNKLVKVKGLNFYDLLISPHHTTEEDRTPFLLKTMQKTPGKAVALDDCSAIHIQNNTFKIINCDSKSGASLVYKKDKKVVFEKILEGFLSEII